MIFDLLSLLIIRKYIGDQSNSKHFTANVKARLSFVSILFSLYLRPEWLYDQCQKPIFDLISVLAILELEPLYELARI